MSKRKPFVDLREQLRHVTLTAERQYGITFRNAWRVYLGLTVVQLGCALAGINFEEPDEIEDLMSDRSADA
jgi:hypothetical protein